MTDTTGTPLASHSIEATKLVPDSGTGLSAQAPGAAITPAGMTPLVPTDEKGSCMLLTSPSRSVAPAAGARADKLYRPGAEAENARAERLGPKQLPA